MEAPVSLLMMKLDSSTTPTISRLMALAYWFQPFSFYWNSMVVRTAVDGVISRMNSDSSRMQEMNGSR